MPAVKPCSPRPASIRSAPVVASESVAEPERQPVFHHCSWAEDAARRSYQVPAGSLSDALTRFAGLAGVNLSVDPALVSGRTSAGLSGDYGVEEGFSRCCRVPVYNCSRWANRRTS
jgi:iron complex outermembrane receptor protein